MQVRILCGALAAFLAATAPSGKASAQALPGWKITDICVHESAPGQCAAFEGRAYNAVSASWSILLESVRQACLTQLKSPYDRSWRLLETCIEDENLMRERDKAAIHTAKTSAEPVAPAMVMPTPPPPPTDAPPSLAPPAGKQ
jgi:hypothetical protein